MNLTVNRFHSDDRGTISRVLVNTTPSCYGLEDPHQDHKIPGLTRIPAGKYKVAVRTFGGHHEKYLVRFPFHKGMLEIKDVPGFSDILIHCGNTPEDTRGCLLVGKTADKINMRVGQSALAYERLYADVIGAALKGWLEAEFADKDRGD